MNLLIGKRFKLIPHSLEAKKHLPLNISARDQVKTQQMDISGVYIIQDVIYTTNEIKVLYVNNFGHVQALPINAIQIVADDEPVSYIPKPDVLYADVTPVPEHEIVVTDTGTIGKPITKAIPEIKKVR